FEVDDQIELSWRLHGKVGRLSAFENAVNIRRRLGKLLSEIASISYQTASLGEFAPKIHRRYAMAGRQQNDLFGICPVEGVGRQNEAAPLIARLPGDNAFDLILGTDRCCLHLNS